MVENHPQNNMVDQALAKMRSTPLPQGPSPQALERTVQAVRTAQLRPERISLMERIRQMNRLIKYPAAAVLAIALLAGAAYLLLGHETSTAFGFEAVKEKFDKAETMTMNVTTTMPGHPKPITMKLYFKSPGLMRQEMAENIVAVTDLTTGKAVSLVPKAKLAVEIELGDINLLEPQMRDSLDFVGCIRKLLKGAKKDLGEKTLNGRKLRGFHAEQDGRVMEIWVDAKTADPVSLEFEAAPGANTTITDFVINPKLDDALFVLKIPKDFKVQKQRIDLGQAGEKNLLAAMRYMAQYNDGVFPQDLTITPKILANIQKAKAKLTANQRADMAMAFGKMTAFLAVTQARSQDFRYVGNGVKLGDKKAVVVFWLIKGAKEYRVVYGDLRVENVAKDKMPTTFATTQPTTNP